MQKLNSFFQGERRGFAYAFLAAFCYSIMASIVKLATEVPPVMLVFFRNLTCFILLLPIFLKMSSFKTGQIKLYIFRALMGFMTLNCFYYAAKHLLLVDSVMLINTAPIFIPLIMYLWDKVKIPYIRMLGIASGFIGVLFILRPRFDFFNLSGAIGILSGIGMAASMVTLKKLSKTEPTEKILFYFFFGNIILGFFPTISVWKTFENNFMWAYILLVGITGFLFQLLTTKAYTYAHPTKVSTIAYLAVVFSGIMGYICFGNIPTYLSLIGSFLIILGGIIVITDGAFLFRKKQKKI